LSKKLHILFLCSWYPSKVLPTNGDFIQRHAEAVSLQHKVSVLHIISDNTLSESKIDIKEVNNVQTLIGYVKPTKNPILKSIRFIRVYKKIMHKLGSFDVIHLNVLFPFGVFALHQKTFRKIPFIISEHWTGYHKPQSNKISFVEHFISKRITKKATFVCPVSKNLKKSMIDFGLLGQYISVPNVVDTDLFKPQTNNENSLTIIHASGMNDAHKNISGMLKVARILEDQIPDFTWEFIGGKADQFTELINQLGFKRKTINFIDHITQKELAVYFKNASLFVLFSNYENLPCVILEAFSAGLPVISTNVGGIDEYFPSNFGCLIEKGNTKQLEEKIKKIAEQENSNKNEMHLYAKKHFSKEAIATSFTLLYNQAINNQN